MKIYYINLKKSKERREKLTEQLDKLNIKYERIDAEYGKSMSKKDIEDLCYKPTGMMCPRSIIGCYASHLKAWKRFYNDSSNKKYGIIMEDDCIIEKNFEKNVNLLLEEINNKHKAWDFLYLGHYNLKLFSIFPDISEKTKNTKLYTIPDGIPLGFHCYIINKKSAKKLITIMNKMYYHIDLQFYFFSKYFNVYSSRVNLAKQIITSEHSTQNVNFPFYTNKLMDMFFYKDDDCISPSYILSSPLIKVPLIDFSLTSYVILFIVLCKTSDKLKNIVLLYLILELSIGYNNDALLSSLFVYFFTKV